MLHSWYFNLFLQSINLLAFIKLLEPFSLELVYILQSFSYLFLPKQSSHQSIMVISFIIPCKRLHYIIEILLLLRSLFVQLLLLLYIQYLSINNELFPSYSFSQTRIIDLNEPIFHAQLLFTIVIVELQL